MSSPISGFTAIPNPQMLAFMPIQSYLMMYFAGSGWQYGKRRISAMSNEQFNKLGPEDLLRQHSVELKNMIPTLEKSLNDVTPLIKILVQQYGDFLVAALQATPKAVGTVAVGLEQQLFPKSEGSLYDLVEHWLKQQFPNMPDADAHSKAVEIVEENPLQLAAIQKQKDYERQQLLAKEAHTRLVRGKTVIAPTGATAPVRFKQGAGQSAKMERLRLIRVIVTAGKTLKILLAKQRKGTATGNDISKLGKLPVILKQYQQRLVNLLDRYRFN